MKAVSRTILFAAVSLLVMGIFAACRQPAGPSSYPAPGVNSVRIERVGDDEVMTRGSSVAFMVTVDAHDGASTDVDWVVSGNLSDRTYIMAPGSGTAILNISSGELTSSALTVTARSKFDPEKSDSAEVELLPVSKANLQNAISDANAIRSDARESSRGDGTDVSVLYYWVDSSTWTAFTAILNTASALANKPVLGDDDLTAKDEYGGLNRLEYVTAQLTNAVVNFNNVKVANGKGLLADKTDLANKIAEAGSEKAGVETSADGSDFTAEYTWVTGHQMNAFDEAISTAVIVRDNNAATEEQIRDAVEALDAAIEAFKEAKKPGTLKIQADKANLNNAISKALSDLGGVLTNTLAENVTAGQKWALIEDRDTFAGAINTAQGVSENTDATQAEVNDAVSALAAADGVFQSKIKLGTRSTVTKDNLLVKIGEANAAKAGVVVNTAGGNVPPGTYWVTVAQLTAFDDSIKHAQSVYNTSDDQEQVDQEVLNLGVAITLFAGQKTEGTYHAPADRGTLNTAISGAYRARTTVVVNTEASNVPVGTYWVTQEELNGFNAAIAAAESTAADQSADDNAVSGAADAMTAATVEFLATTRQKGTRATLDDLNKAIFDALADQYGVTVSDSPDDVADIVSCVSNQELIDNLNEAIADAEDAVVNGSSQELADAAVALAEAREALEAAKQDGTSTEPSAYQEALIAAVNAAGEVKESVIAHASQDEAAEGEWWVTMDVMAAFEAAINTANSFTSSDNINAIKTAKADLDAALAVFTGAIQNGAQINLGSLNVAITSANLAKAGVYKSFTGANVPTEAEWVTETQLEAFEYAIAAAVQTAATATTQADVTAAVSALEDATASFSSQKQAGKYVVPANMQDLNGLLAKARAAKTQDGKLVATVADDAAYPAYHVSAGTKWVTVSQMETFDQVIAAAEAIAVDTTIPASAQESVVSPAEEALSSAITVFEDQVKDGSRANIDALVTAINEAENARTENDLRISESGTGSEWFPIFKYVPRTVWGKFDATIENAKAVREKVLLVSEAVNQAAVDDAVAKLKTSTSQDQTMTIEEFKAEIKDGTSLPAGVVGISFNRPGDISLDELQGLPLTISKISQESLSISLGPQVRLQFYMRDGIQRYSESDLVNGKIVFEAIALPLGARYVTIVFKYGLDDTRVYSNEIRFEVVN